MDQYALRNAAEDYAARGWFIFPCKPGQKIPATANGFKAATNNRVKVARWWSDSRDWWHRNIAVVTCKESDLVGIDCDVDKMTGELGEDSLADLIKEFGPLPPHPIQITPSGGEHHLFRWPADGGDFPRRIRIRPGLDLLGARETKQGPMAGYMLLAPSETPAGRYRWKDGLSPKDVAIPHPPQWLVNLNREYKQEYEHPEGYVPQKPVRSAETTNYGRTVLAEECSKISSASPGSQDDTLIRSATRIGSVAHGGQIDVQEAMQAVIAAGMQMTNQQGRERWTQEDIRKKAARAFAFAARDPYQKKEGQREIQQSRPQPTLAVDNTNPEAGSPQQPARNWRDGHRWALTSEGTLHTTAIHNALLTLRHHPDIKGCFAQNDFTGQIEVLKPLPTETRKRPHPRELEDNDETAVSGWLNLQGLRTAISVNKSVIHAIAAENRHDPLMDYLNTIQWDGDHRLDTWLIDYCGSPQTDYHRIIGRKYLISAAARGLRPGCKVDTMLILEGAQGVGKSTLAATLAGPQWFTDQVGDVTSKDASERLSGAWIVEVAEMDKFSRAEANAVKEFLSRTDDRYRPAYARNVVRRLRRCVFMGTINPDGTGYLRDTTGNRRFWPVACGRIDLEGIARHRDQLWAEAVFALKEGEEWWISDADADLVSQEQEDRRDDDLWEPEVRKWLDGWETPEYFTSAQVLKDCLGIQPAMQKHAEKIRIAKLLRYLGCRPAIKQGGLRGRGWHWPKGEI